MSRYFNADTFFKMFPELNVEPYNAVPTVDAVEVIRCEHCLHWDDEIENGVYVGNLYHCCDYTGEHKDYCDFCSDAERRNND